MVVAVDKMNGCRSRRTADTRTLFSLKLKREYIKYIPNILLSIENTNILLVQ